MASLVTINCGSSSIRVKVFDRDGHELAAGLLELVDGEAARWRLRRRRSDSGVAVTDRTTRAADHREGFSFLLEENRRERFWEDTAETLGVVHRVVHGGEVLREPVEITDDVIEAIRRLEPLAPLHNPFGLLGIEIVREALASVRQVAVFDTAFHHSLPPRAHTYALPQPIRTEYGIRRYGFHGLSHSYVAASAARHLGKQARETNLITLHLGNGASATAVAGGLSVDTSMGFTPLEGLVMGSRCGDLDASVPAFLVRQGAGTADEIDEMLQSRSGLVGLCGSNDMREIQRRVDAGDADAQLALDVYCYRIRKYVGAYFAVLGRVDAVVFTGGIGENSATVRARACEGLDGFGVRIDDAKNCAPGDGTREIQADTSPVRVLVVPTDEEREMAGQALALLDPAHALARR